MFRRKLFSFSNFREALLADGAIPLGIDACPPKAADGHYLISAFSAQIPIQGKLLNDCHFYRQLWNGRWSEQIENSGKIIAFDFEVKSYHDLKTAFLSHSNVKSVDFVGWFQIPNQGLDITFNKAVFDIHQKIPEKLERSGLAQDYVKAQIEIYENRVKLENSPGMFDKKYLRKYHDNIERFLRLPHANGANQIIRSLCLEMLTKPK